jgi:poly(A) polymerase
MKSPATRDVIRALAAGGGQPRFVGGCVRDTVARRPVKDIDIATPLKPERVIELLAAAKLRSIPTGIGHGTVTALARGRSFEITTLRRDVETYGRHARVAFTDDWEADAARRDFTINALYADPDGTIYDPTGGLADLERGRVRFVGDPRERITEDVLRLLRFFRFHAFYGKGAPDRAGLAACREFAPQVKNLSGERVRVELLRLLAAKDPARITRLMTKNGVLPFLKNHRRLARAAKLTDDPLVRLGALLAPSDAASVAMRLRLSNAERQRLLAMLGPARSFDRHLLYRIGAEAYRDRALLAGRKLSVPKSPVFPIAGRDLRARGVAEGPAIGRLLARVERWWLSRDFKPSRRECLAYLERIGRNHGMTPRPRR